MGDARDRVHENVHLVRAGRQHVHHGNLPGPTVRKAILRSWERSRGFGLAPHDAPGTLVLEGDALVAARQANQELISAAEPVLAELRQRLAGTDQVVTLCDAAARALLVEGELSARRAADRICLIPGSDWSESASGTNAMGTALAEGHLVTVYASEHYLESLHSWACVAAPIRHPITQELLGVLDLSGELMNVNAHTQAAISQSVQAILARLSVLEAAYRQALLEAFADQAVLSRGLAAGVLDRRGNLLKASGVRLDQAGEWREALAEVLRTGREYEGEQFRLRPVRLAGVVIGALVDAGVRLGRGHVPAGGSSAFSDLVGSSPKWLAALDRASRAAQSTATVLLTGETGTGKEVLARAIHRASSRSKGPFVAVNCGAIAPALVSSELFGYVGGAFTGANPRGSAGKVETANGGTLFLDEVSELTPEAQVHLLRVLQEREIVRVGSPHAIPVDVRVIAATNRDLAAMVQQGRFRQDLYYRLNVIPISLPPLRERRQDILPLVNHAFLRQGVTPPDLGRDSYERLMAHDWPGNVRELMNLVEQAVVLGENPADLLPLPPLTLPKASVLGEAGEEERIRRALAACDGNASAAAKQLGISRSTLYRKLELYGIRLGRQVQ